MDATRSGALTADAFKWKMHGFLPTFASPVMDGERLYTMDNGAIVGAFDLKTGERLWTKTLGTLQKGSPVLADGKLYVGTENGKFYILKPSATGVEVLDEDCSGPHDKPEPIIASPDRRRWPRLRRLDGRRCRKRMGRSDTCAIGTRRRAPAAAPAVPPRLCATGAVAHGPGVPARSHPRARWQAGLQRCGCLTRRGTSSAGAGGERDSGPSIG